MSCNTGGDERGSGNTAVTAWKDADDDFGTVAMNNNSAAFNDDEPTGFEDGAASGFEEGAAFGGGDNDRACYNCGQKGYVRLLTGYDAMLT
jgi:hypothetical protein